MRMLSNHSIAVRSSSISSVSMFKASVHSVSNKCVYLSASCVGVFKLLSSDIREASCVNLVDATELNLK